MLTVTINVGVADNHDQIDKNPNPASSQSKEHDDAGDSVAGVEPVDAPCSHKNAEEQGYQPSVLFVLNRTEIRIR